jgi:Zn-dependent protease with chaperone function
VIGVYLLAIAAVTSAAAPRILPHARWAYRAPQLGLAAWYAVLTATSLAVLAAVVSLSVGAPLLRSAVSAWAARCVHSLHGAHGLAGQIVAAAVLAGAALLALRAMLLAGRLAQAITARRREHTDMIAIVGTRSPHLDATVVDSPLPVAYLVPGRPARIVISTGTMATLTPAQLAAVLAHERAHAAGRHHQLADTARLLVAAFPRTAIFTAARDQIDRLIELRADDVAAAGGHRRLDLARALVTMAEAAHAHRYQVPAGAVAATSGNATERVRRLLDPPTPLSVTARAAVWATLAGVAAAPLLVLTLAALAPAFAGCPTLSCAFLGP